ncbi:MAG: hypothetical protein JO269_12885 [Burkholderiaceae bacterium]|nr:hypothetical protein [Burkholderiaceae bacterium]
MRLTASDRPGVAQPVPERHVPERPWGWVWLLALALFVALMAGWELYWRDYGAVPAYANSDSSWAAQRRRIDQGEGNALVLVGSSRTLFDVQLPVWEKVAGERPIQLALEGTSGVPLMEDLADDPNFTGRLVVGVTPGLFFSGFAFREAAIKYFHKETPSQRVGQWLSQRFIEPYFAYYSPDFALETVIERQDWPVRPGTHPRKDVRKLSVSEADRNTHMWSKVENDTAYRDLARSIWAQNFTGPPPPFMDTPEKARQVVQKQIARAAAAVDKLRARGVRIVFIRLPSAGDYYAFEQKTTPRAATWEVLLQQTHLPGIHFEDYPQLQGYNLPEWSHVSSGDALRLTAELAPLVEKALAEQTAKP